MQNKIVTFGLSVLFVLFVGCFDPGIGIAVFWGVLVAALTKKLHESGGTNKFIDWANTLAALGLAALPAVTTNQLAVSVGGYTLAFYLLLLVLRCGAPRCQISPGTLPALFFHYGLNVIQKLCEGVHDTLTLRNIKIGRKVIIGLLISIAPLMLFHSLFASANDDYARVIKAIVEFVFNVEAVERIIQIWALYIVLQAMLNFSLLETEYPKEEVPREAAITISVVPALVLFGVFSLFQGTAVASTLDLESFKELTLYVQQGFWQLLTAGVLGLGFWLLLHRKGADVSKFITVPQVLNTFSLLLLCISLFTAHKVAVLQWSFGFKDQRLYASLAVLLLVIGSILGMLMVRGRLSSADACRWMTTVALASVCSLGWLNVDLLASTVNPIRFYIDEKPSRDLSYLLGNSFDNVSAWNELMEEGISSGVKVAPNYYWGKYLPLCTRNNAGSVFVYLQNRNNNLINKYSSEIASLRQLGAFNLQEFSAYRWLLSNRLLTEQFYAAARASC